MDFINFLIKNVIWKCYSKIHVINQKNKNKQKLNNNFSNIWYCENQFVFFFADFFKIGFCFVVFCLFFQKILNCKNSSYSQLWKMVTNQLLITDKKNKYDFISFCLLCITISKFDALTCIKTVCKKCKYNYESTFFDHFPI